MVFWFGDDECRLMVNGGYVYWFSLERDDCVVLF